MQAGEMFSKNLNPQQKLAVEKNTGPLLVLAGAGSGKTRVLTHRCATLIATGQAAPHEILAVTFTNKAAREMESRILELLSKLNYVIGDPLWISTFHSICARILREHAHMLDYKPSFAIYDGGDQLSMIKKVLNALNINEKMHPAKSFQARINNAKMMGWDPNDLQKNNSHWMDKKSYEVYAKYEEDMKRSNAMDFGDLLLKTYDLFRCYPDLLGNYQTQFKYIMVDEYQDTNHIQYQLVKMLAEKHRNLCVVGDEDQSIYSWRGADIGNILNFEQDFPEAQVIKLEENYRSTQTIVSAATHVIKNNQQRKDKTLFTSNDPGERIVVREEGDEYAEARYVVQETQTLLSQNNYSYSDVAIFYRTNAQSRVLEEQLRGQGIPYRLVGGMKFYERMEIKDMLSYLRLSLNPNDDVAFKRVINVPTRGVGKTTVGKIEDIAATQACSLFEATGQAIANRAIHTGAIKKLSSYLQLIERIQEDALKHSLSDLYHIILDITEYTLRLKKDESSEAAARLDNLEELDNAISQFEDERGEEGTLQAFLEEIALVSDVDSMNENQNCVTLMTLHISKGLEFPIVFIVGMEEGLFPSGQSMDSSDPSLVEEERRLAYVGMTRARERLLLTHARKRRVWGSEQYNPQSRFIQEIPDEFCLSYSSVKVPNFMKRQQSGDWQDDTHSDEFDVPGSFPNYENFADEAFDEENVGFTKGMKVRHPTFGVGSIFQTEGAGDQQKVSVSFSDRTVKKFVVKYARLERV